MAIDQAFAVVTVDDVKNEVRDIGDLDLAEHLLLAGTEEIETVLNRKLVSRGTITEFHTFRRGSSKLYLNQFPVMLDSVTGDPLVTSVHEDESRVYGAASLLVEGTDYVIDVNEGALIRIEGDIDSTWLTGFEAIKVIYEGGYTQADVPQDIKRIARELFARQYRDVIEQRQSAVTIQDGLGSRTFFAPADLTSHMVKRLMRHKKFDFGERTMSRWSVSAV